MPITHFTLGQLVLCNFKCGCLLDDAPPDHHGRLLSHIYDSSSLNEKEPDHHEEGASGHTRGRTKYVKDYYIQAREPRSFAT